MNINEMTDEERIQFLSELYYRISIISLDVELFNHSDHCTYLFTGECSCGLHKTRNELSNLENYLLSLKG